MPKPAGPPYNGLCLNEVQVTNSRVLEAKLPAAAPNQGKVQIAPHFLPHYFEGIRCASPAQYQECGIPLNRDTTVGRYHDPRETDIERQGSEAFITCNYGSKSRPEWFEFRSLPKRLAGPNQPEPPGSDSWGARRALAAFRLSVALGTTFVPPTVFCLDRDGKLGIGVPAVPFCDSDDAKPWLTDPADLQDVEDCACFLALLGYSDGPSRIHFKMDPESRSFVRNSAGRLYAFSQRNFDAFRGIRGHFPEGPVIDQGRGNGYTIATLSPAFRQSLQAMNPYRLRLALGNLVNESVILMTVLTLRELQAGIIALDKPDKKGANERSKQSCCAIL